MTYVTTWSGKIRPATWSEQLAIDQRRRLQDTIGRLQNLRARVQSYQPSIAIKVNDIEAEYDLHGDKFAQLHNNIETIIASRSGNISRYYISDAVSAIDAEITRLSGAIYELAIPIFYPDLDD